MKEDQTDLNNIKHFFINDERIKPPVGHTSQQKPLWVEGLVLGDSSGDEEYFGEETEGVFCIIFGWMIKLPFVGPFAISH